jgi:hypothetical protein
MAPAGAALDSHAVQKVQYHLLVAF